MLIGEDFSSEVFYQEGAFKNISSIHSKSEILETNKNLKNRYTNLVEHSKIIAKSDNDFWIYLKNIILKINLDQYSKEKNTNEMNLRYKFIK